MKTIRINSTPTVHVPNVARWISEIIRPHSSKKAASLYASLGIPTEVANDLALAEPVRSTLKYFDTYILIEFTPMRT